jgi:hypothetical protein
MSVHGMSQSIAADAYRKGCLLLINPILHIKVLARSSSEPSALHIIGISNIEYEILAMST